ncbi:MAG: hypothetical protein PHC60_05940 [Heliobacteriaceae bacterium]|nr:hypothetical protein [Heliobacteriaceae bacterium]MDD4587906.1 hypothetical protein [Heliobacteriaceae bacterium]
MIWWLDQLKDPAMLIRCVLLGGGVPPWLTGWLGTGKGRSSQAGADGSGLQPDELVGPGELPEAVWPALADLDYEEDVAPDPEIIKEGLKKAFG